VLLDLILASTNERVVVVSSRRETLDVIAKYVRERQRSTSAVVMLTGSVKGELRETRKTLFNLKGASGARVCCLVDKMAEGQTLTGASHLVLLDATWHRDYRTATTARGLPHRDYRTATTAETRITRFV